MFGFQMLSCISCETPGFFFLLPHFLLDIAKKPELFSVIYLHTTRLMYMFVDFFRNS